jgi:hypothetical protein
MQLLIDDGKRFLLEAAFVRLPFREMWQCSDSAPRLREIQDPYTEKLLGYRGVNMGDNDVVALN